jgi:hypothetical protein
LNHVKDDELQAALDRAVELGTKELMPVTDAGTASIAQCADLQKI